QRFHQAVALHGSRLGNKPGLGFLVAEVLADDRDLGQDLSVVQHESRNIALGVDLPIIAAVGGLLVGDVNPLEIQGGSGFASHDVRGHGAGARGVVEFHVRFLSGAVDWANSNVPKQSCGYPITSSARASSLGGTLRPSVPSTNIRLHPVVEHPGDV